MCQVNNVLKQKKIKKIINLQAVTYVNTVGKKICTEPSVSENDSHLAFF